MYIWLTATEYSAIQKKGPISFKIWTNAAKEYTLSEILKMTKRALWSLIISGTIVRAHLWVFFKIGELHQSALSWFRSLLFEKMDRNYCNSCEADKTVRSAIIAQVSVAHRIVPGSGKCQPN